MATKPIEAITSQENQAAIENGQQRRPRVYASRQQAEMNVMCPRYEHAIQLLGKRWTGLILDSLMQGPRRFCELTASVEGLSDRVLSDRLRELELEGVIERVVYPQIPVRVEYRLTDKGYDLKPVVEAIHHWAEQWIPLSDSTSDPTSSQG